MEKNVKAKSTLFLLHNIYPLLPSIPKVLISKSFLCSRTLPATMIVLDSIVLLPWKKSQVGQLPPSHTLKMVNLL